VLAGEAAYPLGGRGSPRRDAREARSMAVVVNPGGRARPRGLLGAHVGAPATDGRPCEGTLGARDRRAGTPHSRSAASLDARSVESVCLRRTDQARHRDARSPRAAGVSAPDEVEVGVSQGPAPTSGGQRAVVTVVTALPACAHGTSHPRLSGRLPARRRRKVVTAGDPDHACAGWSGWSGWSGAYPWAGAGPWLTSERLVEGRPGAGGGSGLPVGGPWISAPRCAWGAVDGCVGSARHGRRGWRLGVRRRGRSSRGARCATDGHAWSSTPRARRVRPDPRVAEQNRRRSAVATCHCGGPSASFRSSGTRARVSGCHP